LIPALENDPLSQSAVVAFREGLATFGWFEGRNLRIEYRFSGGDLSRLAAGAAELVNLRPEVIFALSGPAARAVQQRTSVIPIVFVGRGDPASIGAVRNVARPEDNVTGFANYFASLGGRWLELFKEAVPRLTRVADINFASEIFPPNNELELRAAIRAAAAQLGVTIIRMPVRNAVEIEHRISVFAAEPDGGLLLTGPNSITIFGKIGRLALYHHLPLMWGGVAGPAEGLLGGVRPAARRSDRVRKSRIRSTAVHRRVSGSDGDVGNGPSGRAMRTTARTRRGHSARGFKAIATIGASIGARIPSTARATALRRASGNASVGGVRRSLQRWTRQGRFRACRQGLIGWCRRVTQSLQRWTRGSWK
jgi:putative tryptophan/tyrosine transport system substrate-binding protein